MYVDFIVVQIHQLFNQSEKGIIASECVRTGENIYYIYIV